MRKFLIKILLRILGMKVSTPHLVDGNEFIIKFHDRFYIMTSSTLEQNEDGKEKLHITFTDILSVVNKNERRWDFK